MWCRVLTQVPCGTDVAIIFFISFQANEDVTQIVEILHSGPSKWNWLTRRLVEFTSSGSVLLFVTKKANAEELANNLKQEGHNLGLLHGDMDQSERNKVISDFKKKDIPVLVATDVAGRVCISPVTLQKQSTWGRLDARSPGLVQTCLPSHPSLIAVRGATQGVGASLHRELTAGTSACTQLQREKPVWQKQDVCSHQSFKC